MHHLYDGLSSFPSVVCQTLSLVRSVCRISEGAEGAFCWRGRTVAVSITCVESSVWLLLNSKLKRIRQVLFCRDAPCCASCRPCCLPFTCQASGWDHLPTDSCSFTRTAALWKAVPNSSYGCSSPVVLAVHLLPGGEKYSHCLRRRYLKLCREVFHSAGSKWHLAATTTPWICWIHLSLCTRIEILLKMFLCMRF